MTDRNNHQVPGGGHGGRDLHCGGILILFSSFFSASSTSVFSVGGPRIRTLVEEGFRGAEELSELRSRAGTIQGPAVFRPPFPVFSRWDPFGLGAMEWGISGFLAGYSGLRTAVILLGELLPRIFAASRSVQVALAVAPAVILLEKAFNPLLLALPTPGELPGPE